MATLRIDDEAFRREREVVKEERRMRVENQPYGRLSEIIYDHAFTTHPYKHPTIGSMADLEAASIADVREFHETYYVPENATVTIVGDFDAVQTLSDGDAVLRPRAEGEATGAARHPEGAAADQRAPRGRSRRRGRCRPSSSPITSPTTAIPTPIRCTSPRRSCRTGRARAFRVELMYNKRIALTAFGSGNITEDPNLFYAVAIVQPGQTPEAAEQALIAEFDKLAQEPVTASELQRAKNQFARDYIVSRESNEDKARHLAHAAVIHNDIATADGEFDIFMNVTRGRRAARGEDLLHAEQSRRPPHPPQAEARDERGCWLWALGSGLVVGASRRVAQAAEWPTEARAAAAGRRTRSSSRRSRCGRCRTACR